MSAAVVVAAMMGMSRRPALAASAFWSGPATGNWNNGLDWSTSSPPGSTSSTTNPDIATFNNGLTNAVITVDSARNIQNITFDTNALNYSLTGGSLLLSSGGTVSIASTASATARVDAVNSPMTLEGNYSFINNASSSAANDLLTFGGAITSGQTAGTTVLTLGGTYTTTADTISGVISNGGGSNVMALNASGGSWILGGINTYTGPTTVTAGTLQLGPAATSSSTFTYGAMNISAGAVVTENPASGTVGTPVMTIGSLSGAGNFNYLNSLTGVASLAINQTANTYFSGIVQPTNTANGNFVLLSKNGAGTLNFNGAAGALDLQRGMAVNAGNVTLSGNATLVLPKTATGRDLFSINQGASITIDDTLTNVTNRLGVMDDSLTLNGGTFTVLGSSAAQTTENDTDHNGSSSVAVGLVFGPGADTINVVAGAGQFALFNVNVGGYSRSAGSSPLVEGTSLGSVNGGANVSSVRFGSNAPAITGSGVSLGILPGVIIDSVSTSGASNTYGIATYNSPNGFVALTPGVNNTGLLTAGANVDATAALTNATLTINSLQLDSGGSIDNTAGTLNISTGTILSTGANVSIGVGGGSTLKDSSTTTETVIYNAAIDNNPASVLTIGATIVSPLGLTKGGAGTTILTADNSAGLINGSSGVPITINGGILSISATNNLGAANNTINLNNGGELQSTGEAVTLGSGAITVGSATANTLSGGTIAVGGASTNVLTQGTGLIGGAGSLKIAGVGTASLTGQNTYTGGTILSGGTLSLAAAQGAMAGPMGGGTGSLPTGLITFNGGTLQYTATNTVDYSSRFSTAAAQQFNVDTGGQNVTWASALNSAGGSLTKLGGSGTLTLSGNNIYNGSTAVLAGMLYAGSAAAFSPNSAFNIAGGTLDTTAFASTISALTVGSSGGLNLNYSNPLTVNNAAAFAGLLNLTGTPGTLPETLINYNSESGTFSSVNGVPSGDVLSYTSNALLLMVGSTGPATLTWNNAAATGTWDTTSANWNNGSGNIAYSDTSNTSTGDIVTFGDSSNANYSVAISGTVHPTSVTFNNSAGNYTLTGANASSGIAGTTSLTKLGTGSVTLASSNTYTGGTNVAAGSLIVASANALPAGGSLSVASGAVVQIANHSGASPYVPTLGSLANSGTIDITNNAMVIQNNSIGTITSMVAAAYNNGQWNGNSAAGAITSSQAAADSTHLTAVGVATGLSTFEGQNVSAGSVLVKYTYYGDANLDGAVDGSDYSLIDNGYLLQLTGWQNGDFNYDGVVNGSDYTLIDNAFNVQGAQISAEVASPTAQIAGGVSAVPEPASLGLLAMGLVGLLGRRRR